MTTTRRPAGRDITQLLWRVRATAQHPPMPTVTGELGGSPAAPCPGLVIEHVDGTAACELGAGCRVDVDAHDVGADCPGPEAGCAHCRQVFTRCDAPVIEHGPGDGTGRLVCTAGHDADDLDPDDGADRAGDRVYHPGHDTYPCVTAPCPACAGSASDLDP